MLNIRQLLGIKGEASAVRFLKKNGCAIIETNYRTRLGEIDIVASDGDIIVFVEVKTRKKEGMISPKEAVTPSKQRTISKLAQTWLKSKGKYGMKARFDVIAIISDRESERIEWVKNAFESPTF